jgi:hypothetical protein
LNHFHVVAEIQSDVSRADSSGQPALTAPIKDLAQKWMLNPEKIKA